MDKLKKCISIFESMMHKDFYLTLENNKVMKVFFARKHLHHLLGFQYLIDIPPLVIDPKNSATTIYNNINNGRITYNQILKSSFYPKISDRIDNFSHINNLMFEKIIIDFNKNKVPSAPDYIPLIKAKYILYTKSCNHYLHLCLGNDNIIYYPETFLVHPNDYYVVGQNELKIENVTIVPQYKKKKINSKIKISIPIQSKIAATTEKEK